MAEIRIIGDINNTVQLNRFDEKDVALLGQNRIINNFGTTKDYVEYHIYDIVGNPLIQSYSYLSYKSPSDVALNIDGTYSFLEIDPVEDLKKQYSNGEFKTTYNFFRNKLGTPVSPLYIKDISDDRTELKIGSVSSEDNFNTVALSPTESTFKLKSLSKIPTKFFNKEVV